MSKPKRTPTAAAPSQAAGPVETIKVYDEGSHQWIETSPPDGETSPIPNPEPDSKE